MNLTKIAGLMVLILTVSVYGVDDSLLPPENLNAVSNLDSRVELSWSPPSTGMPTEELAYDDGMPRGLDPGGHNDVLSVRFSPANACTLKKVMLYMYSPTPPDTIELHLWEDDGYGYPLLFIGDLIEPRQFVVSASYEWIELDLTDDPIVLSSAEFHLGLVKVDSSLHYVLMDGAPSEPPRSFIYQLSAGEILPLDGDLLIRAYVSYAEGKRRGSKQLFRLPEFSPSSTVEPLPLPSSISEIPTSEVVGYKIYRSDEPDGPFFQVTSTESLSYTDNEVSNNHTYYYKATALYSDGESDYTPIVWATPRGEDGLAIDTIRYDDGAPSFAVSWSPGNIMATRFSSTVRKQLTGIQVFVYNPGVMKPVLYSVADGEISEEPIFSMPGEVTVSSSGWYYVDLNRFHIYLQGEFLAGIKLADATLSVGIDMITGTSFSYDYYSRTSSWSNLSDTLYFIRAVTSYDYSNVNIHLNQGWNQVSIPVVPDSPLFSEIMPDIIPPVYKYDASLRRYVIVDSVEAGEGYFVLSPIEVNYNLSGLPVRGFDKQVDRGWNMVGAPSEARPFPCTNVITFPDDLLLDPGYYHYNTTVGSYILSDGLISGKGYWVLCGEEGTIRVE